MKIKIEYLYPNMMPLEYKHCYDAGADVPMYRDITVKHGKNIIPLGFKLIIPVGYAGYLCPRSSVMGDGIAYNLVPFDADYSGEWNMVIYNPSDEFIIRKDSRICQVVIMPILQAEFVTELDNRRGDNGLGSTGK